MYVVIYEKDGRYLKASIDNGKIEVEYFCEPEQLKSFFIGLKGQGVEITGVEGVLCG